MPDPRYANALLVMARKDFDALRGMVGNDLFADEIFGFHAQQAIEKSLKAWLSLLDIEFPFTHDLSRLLALLEDVGADGVTAYLHLVEFTMFAVQARYEAGLMDDEQVLDRPTVITQVQALLSAVESLETKG